MQRLMFISLLLWNFYSYFIYYLDKRKARRSQYRISERTLLMLALLGGGFGAYLSARIHHHKNRKKYFMFGLYLGLITSSLLFIITYLLTK